MISNKYADLIVRAEKLLSTKQFEYDVCALDEASKLPEIPRGDALIPHIERAVKIMFLAQALLYALRERTIATPQTREAVADAICPKRHSVRCPNTSEHYAEADAALKALEYEFEDATKE